VAFVKEPSFVPADGRIDRLRETANDAFLDVESMGRGFLVMSVTPHKYWKFTIDGRAVQSIITNIGYQGLVIPAGRHHVEMRYRNTLAQKGLLVSIVTSILLLAIAIFRRPRASVVESAQ
jgi:uncharacterized membrane protein YfhO